MKNLPLAEATVRGRGGGTLARVPRSFSLLLTSIASSSSSQISLSRLVALPVCWYRSKNGLIRLVSTRWPNCHKHQKFQQVLFRKKAAWSTYLRFALNAQHLLLQLRRRTALSRTAIGCHGDDFRSARIFSTELSAVGEKGADF